MTTVLVPSLSQDGWTSSTKERLDYLMSHFFVSDKSQTALYGDEVSSFPHLVQSNQNNIPGLKSQTQTALYTYLMRYGFKDVVVDVVITPETTNSSRQILELFMEVTDDAGVTMTLSNMLLFNDTKFAQIIKLNNG